MWTVVGEQLAESYQSHPLPSNGSKVLGSIQPIQHGHDWRTFVFRLRGWSTHGVRGRVVGAHAAMLIAPSLETASLRPGLKKLATHSLRNCHHVECITDLRRLAESCYEAGMALHQLSIANAHFAKKGAYCSIVGRPLPSKSR